ncbi:phospholipid-binding protein [Deltaproteobacteria bacterium Smac51]|nr:phospholipid-binding protein [Deltaproteobacteria bacterium Smac51]
MTVQFTWNGNGGSLSSPSPQLNIGNIPDGTVSFNVKMKDLDRKRFDHGGGTAVNDGTGVIPVGALKNYKGPQPPAPEVHTYVFTVSAIDANGQVIGTGTASHKYPGN